jgi:hypothetical protein
MRLQQSVGNRAVAQLVQRQPTTTQAKPASAPAPQKAEKLPLSLSTDPDDAIVFETQKSKLGKLEVYCTGRLSVYGSATFDGEQIPADADLPKDRSKRPSRSRPRTWWRCCRSFASSFRGTLRPPTLSPTTPRCSPSSTSCSPPRPSG